MENILIREAKVSELDKLYAIEQLIIEAERPFEENMQNKDFHYYDIEQLILNEDSFVIGAETNHQIIATGYAKIAKSLDYLKDDYHAYLGFMYVDPAFRGQGVNQLIIDTLIEWSRKKGLTVVCLEVFNGNQMAVKAYRKSGFSENMVKMRLNLDAGN